MFITACVLTFVGPEAFTLTGNGYFAVWFGFISSIALYRESYGLLDNLEQQQEGIGNENNETSQPSAIYQQNQVIDSLATI